MKRDTSFTDVAGLRVGHATDGGVMGAAVACLMGGTAVLAGGIIAVLGRE